MRFITEERNKAESPLLKPRGVSRVGYEVTPQPAGANGLPKAKLVRTGEVGPFHAAKEKLKAEASFIAEHVSRTGAALWHDAAATGKRFPESFGEWSTLIADVTVSAAEKTVAEVSYYGANLLEWRDNYLSEVGPFLLNGGKPPKTRPTDTNGSGYGFNATHTAWMPTGPLGLAIPTDASLPVSASGQYVTTPQLAATKQLLDDLILQGVDPAVSPATASRSLDTATPARSTRSGETSLPSLEDLKTVKTPAAAPQTSPEKPMMASAKPKNPPSVAARAPPKAIWPAAQYFPDRQLIPTARKSLATLQQRSQAATIAPKPSDTVTSQPRVQRRAPARRRTSPAPAILQHGHLSVWPPAELLLSTASRTPTAQGAPRAAPGAPIWPEKNFGYKLTTAPTRPRVRASTAAQRSFPLAPITPVPVPIQHLQLPIVPTLAPRTRPARKTAPRHAAPVVAPAILQHGYLSTWPPADFTFIVPSHASLSPPSAAMQRSTASVVPVWPEKSFNSSIASTPRITRLARRRAKAASATQPASPPTLTATLDNLIALLGTNGEALPSALPSPAAAPVPSTVIATTARRRVVRPSQPPSRRVRSVVAAPALQFGHTPSWPSADWSIETPASSPAAARSSAVLASGRSVPAWPELSNFPVLPMPTIATPVRVAPTPVQVREAEPVLTAIPAEQWPVKRVMSNAVPARSIPLRRVRDLTPGAVAARAAAVWAEEQYAFATPFDRESTPPAYILPRRSSPRESAQPRGAGSSAPRPNVWPQTNLQSSYFQYQGPGRPVNEGAVLASPRGPGPPLMPFM